MSDSELARFRHLSKECEDLRGDLEKTKARLQAVYNSYATAIGFVVAGFAAYFLDDAGWPSWITFISFLVVFVVTVTWLDREMGEDKFWPLPTYRPTSAGSRSDVDSEGVDSHLP